MPYKDKEAGKEHKRQYYLKNKDRMKKTFKKNYLENRQERINKTKEYWLKNKNLVNNRRKNYEKKLRKFIFNELGNTCVCCGESIERFLTIDHVNGGGSKHRREKHNALSLYLDIIKRGVPKEEFQLLCFNCNMGRYYNGGICPHKQK